MCCSIEVIEKVSWFVWFFVFCRLVSIYTIRVALNVVAGHLRRVRRVEI